ncbi:MAG: DNA alkylation repair protein [Aerococcaceae bacterium]|nr:DNA alkylation repair protein [Aerococcaceae bacterium]
MRALRQLLQQASNPVNASAMSAYLRHQFVFFGIKKAELRPLTRLFLKEKAKATVIDWAFVCDCWAQPEREFHYVALDYIRAMKRHLLPQDLPRLRYLVEHHSWWDSVDDVAYSIGYLVKHFGELQQKMLDWATDDSFWVRRVAIIHQLGHKEAVNTELLTKIITHNLGSREFFINKAIGWALRDYAKYNAAWVRNFLREHHDQLAPLSVREATKHLD